MLSAGGDKVTISGKEAIKKLEKQYKRQNEHIKQNYDRVSVTLPAGTKERIKATGESINGYITRLVLEDLEQREDINDPSEDNEQESSDLPDCFK